MAPVLRRIGWAAALAALSLGLSGCSDLLSQVGTPPPTSRPSTSSGGSGGSSSSSTSSSTSGSDVGSSADPSGSIHLALGNPSDATTDPANYDNYLLINDQYALSYNRDKAIPNWVSWHLEASNLGSTERYEGQFIPDDRLPEGWYRVEHRDYSGSNYDRGHMTPSADRTSSEKANIATFILTNVIPQAPENNRGPWAALEEASRALVDQGYELYIVSGGVGDNGTIADGRISVPAAVWKVAIVIKRGSDDLNRMTAQTESFAVIMPNDSSVGSSWEDYRTSVDCIEQVTGYNFFGRINDDIESAIEAQGGDCPAFAEQFVGANGVVNAPSSAAGVEIINVEFNPPGDDIVGEYVLLRNSGSKTIDLSGWELRDSGGAVYIFSAFTLKAGAEVRIWTGSGADTASDLFWNRTQAVWNNDGDTATLRDANGKLVAEFSY